MLNYLNINNFGCLGYFAQIKPSIFLFSLGYHLWNHDIRLDDNPVEADLRGICRENGQYLGKQHVDKLRKHGCYKRRAFFTMQNDICLHGNETIWRDDHIVGYLRRGNYGYSLDCSIGIGYVLEE